MSSVHEEAASGVSCLLGMVEGHTRVLGSVVRYELTIYRFFTEVRPLFYTSCGWERSGLRAFFAALPHLEPDR